MVEEQLLTPTWEIAQSGLQVEAIHDIERFNAIEPEWDRLVERSGGDRVFSSHAWFRTWWESFGSGKQLHIITVRAGRELVAAAPMMKTRPRMFGIRLHLLESIYNPHVPRCDFIIADRRNDVLYRSIWSGLRDQVECDAVALKQIPEESATHRVIERIAVSDGWRAGEWKPRRSPYVRLGNSHEDLLANLKGTDRYNLRKRYERLQGKGCVDVEVITERHAVADAMRDGLRIEAAAWKGGRGTAMICDPAVSEFYVRLAERQADRGQLRLTFLRIAGKRISFSYILRGGNKLCAVKIGYDPDYHAYSPGTMLLNLILKDAIEEGMTEYDFLGDDDEWKLDWTRETRGHRWLFLFRNRPRARLLHFLKCEMGPEVKARLERLCT